MPLVSGDKIHCWYDMTYVGQRYQFHQHYRVVSNTSGQTTDQSLGVINTLLSDTATVGSIGKAFRDSIPGNVTINKVTSQQITTVRSAYREQVMGVLGAWLMGATTGNVSGCITLKGALAGRRFISNRHIGPLASNMYADGTLTNAAIVQFLALGDTLDDPQPLSLGTLNLQPIVNHPGTEFTDVFSFTVSDRVGTMRRRTLRVGI